MPDARIGYAFRMIEAGKLSIDEEALRAFCEKWQIAELALFGSVLRDDFGPDSDVDVLVTFEAKASPTLFDLNRIQEELEAQLGRRVDVSSRRSVERGANGPRRREILSTARVIYGAPDGCCSIVVQIARSMTLLMPPA